MVVELWLLMGSSSFSKQRENLLKTENFGIQLGSRAREGVFPMPCADAVRTRATDDDIMDEEAGRRRLELAAASKQRRATGEAALAEANVQSRQRIAATAAATDDDIMDEEAGRRRLELAAASKQRRETKEAALAEANALSQQRIVATAAATDDDIMDEEAGRRRLELAAASKQRRAAEAREIARQNDEMQRRLASARARTDDGDGLFGGGTLTISGAESLWDQRESDVSLVTYRKFEVRGRQPTYHHIGCPRTLVLSYRPCS